MAVRFLIVAIPKGSHSDSLEQEILDVLRRYGANDDGGKVFLLDGFEPTVTLEYLPSESTFVPLLPARQ